jgi:allophanate hydrolase subunit 1
LQLGGRHIRNRGPDKGKVWVCRANGNQIVTMRAVLARSSAPPTRSFQGLFPGFPYVSRASSDLYTARVATATLSGENMYSANSRARAHMAW